MPRPQANGNLVGGDLVDECKADAGGAALFVPELLAEQVGFGCRAKPQTGRGGFIVGAEPAFGGDDHDTCRFVSTLFAPLGPTHIRPARMFVEMELIQRHRQPGLPEQFAKPMDGPDMLGAFVSVAQEDLVQHSCRSFKGKAR
jgi:hypothetical protein